MAQTVMAIFMLFNMLEGYVQNMSIIDSLPFCTAIEVTYNNKPTLYNYESKEYNDILHTFMQMSQDGHQMPALGVALHDETVSQKQQGMFVEFVFSGVQVYDNMPFESLLIQIEPESQGFNLIRKTDGTYQGRCFYYNLSDNQTMQQLYDVILNIITPNNI